MKTRHQSKNTTKSQQLGKRPEAKNPEAKDEKLKIEPKTKVQKVKEEEKVETIEPKVDNTAAEMIEEDDGKYLLLSEADQEFKFVGSLIISEVLAGSVSIFGCEL